MNIKHEERTNLGVEAVRTSFKATNSVNQTYIENLIVAQLVKKLPGFRVN
jgi:hypothetical protein